MLKAKQKTVSLVVACLTTLLTVLFAFAMLFAPTPMKTASAADKTIVFELGANGEAEHSDGSSATTYTETVDGYKLAVTGGNKMYTGARDAMGNSCIKLGTGSAAGSFTFTVPDDVTSVIIAIANYKTTKANIKINSGTTQSPTKNSNDGAYDEITVDTDTASTKAITLATETGGLRAMVNTITYVIAPSESGDPTCEHVNQTTTNVDATCTENGSINVTCEDCGAIISTETIPATGHENTTENTIDSTCTEEGATTVTCDKCSAIVSTTIIPATGHTYVDGVCTVCGAEEAASGSENLDIFATTGTLASDSLSISWTGVEFTVVNEKNSSSTAIRTSDSSHFRVYVGNKTTIALKNSNYSITKINITCVSSYLAQEADLTQTDAAVSFNGLVATLTFEAAKQEVSFTTSKQWRLTNIEVFYEKATACAHENVTTETVDATCTEAGYSEVTCDDCGAQISYETYEKLGHSYDGDGYCETCGEQDPTSIDYSGYYYIAFKRSAGNYFYVGNTWDSSKDRYVATDSALTELPSSIVEADMGYVFSFVRNDDASYTIYEGKGGKLFAGEIENVNLTANENGTFSITDSNGVYFSFNNSTGNNYIKWYTSVQVREFTLIKAELNANIDSASITIGADLTLNYYVTMGEVLAEDAKMYITVGENEEEEVSYTIEDGRYKFSLEVPPQCMADLITATLKSNGLVLNTVEYSIKTYAQNKLNESSSDELKQLVSDMLRYGAAAQNYKGYNTGSLATDGVENLIAASDAVAPEVSASPVKNPEIDSYPVYFTSATVWFDGVNKIRVKVGCIETASIENASISLDGGETKVALESTTYETEGILATEFDKEFTFQLYYGETLMQTLTYSVNAYAYKMKDHESMGDLATALYRYGVSAEAYIA